jgi:hypothetical protein
MNLPISQPPGLLSLNGSGLGCRLKSSVNSQRLSVYECDLRLCEFSPRPGQLGLPRIADLAAIAQHQAALMKIGNTKVVQITCGVFVLTRAARDV